MSFKSVLVRGDNSHRTERHVDLGMRDPKGRAIGVRVVRDLFTYTPCEPDARSFYDVEPGTYFVVWVQPTRDGEDYGAYTGIVRAKTLEEADAIEARKIGGARKRYGKKFGAA